MSTWTKQKLGDIANVQNGYAFKSKDFSDQGIPVIKIKSMASGKIIFDEGANYPYASDSLEKYFLKKGDILVSMTGSHLSQRNSAVGKITRYNISKPAFLNQRVGKIYPKDDYCDNDFLYYLVVQNDAQEYWAKKAGGTANQANISPEIIKSLPITTPAKLEQQKQIASVLSAYDDLIENNKKRIKILEEMAERLYREWFVKFKFPSHEKTRLIDSGTEYGKIPEGWSVKNLQDVSDVVFGFNFKSKGFKENGAGVRVVRIRDVLDGFTNTFTVEAANKKYEILPGDLLIGMDGIFHMQMWHMKKCFLNQRVAGIRSNIPAYFLLESIKKQLFKLQKTIVGATVGHLANGDIREFKIVLPSDKNLLEPFESITKKIINIRLLSQNISKFRDLLIPQLVTGKREIK